MSYAVLKKCAFGFLLFYCAIGFAARHFARGAEDLYPFFSWSLFAEVPSRTQNSFTLRFYEINGKKLDPPILFEAADGVYDRTAHPMEKYLSLIRELAYSAKGQQADGVARVRRELEKIFLTQSVTYEVVEYAYNPIERWRSGQLGVSKSIAVFHASVSP